MLKTGKAKRKKRIDFRLARILIIKRKKNDAMEEGSNVLQLNKNTSTIKILLYSGDVVEQQQQQQTRSTKNNRMDVNIS